MAVPSFSLSGAATISPLSDPSVPPLRRGPSCPSFHPSIICPLSLSLSSPHSLLDSSSSPFPSLPLFSSFATPPQPPSSDSRVFPSLDEKQRRHTPFPHEVRRILPCPSSNRSFSRYFLFFSKGDGNFRASPSRHNSRAGMTSGNVFPSPEIATFPQLWFRVHRDDEKVYLLPLYHSLCPVISYRRAKGKRERNESLYTGRSLRSAVTSGKKR